MRSKGLSKKYNMEIKEILQTTRWHVWHQRTRSPFFTYIIYRGAADCRPTDFPHGIQASGTVLDWVLTDAKQLDEYGKKVWDVFQNNPGWVLNIMREIQEKNKQDREHWRSYYHQDWSGVDSSTLLPTYREYTQSLLEYGPAIFIPLSIESQLSTISMEYLKKNFGSEWSEYENIVMTPHKESNAILAQRSLLNNTDLKTHLENFAFLKNKGFSFEFNTKDEATKEAQKIAEPKTELARLDEDAQQRTAAWNTIMEKIPDAHGRLLLETTNEAIFFRTWRTEALIQSSWYVVGLFGEIARQIGFSEARDVLYLYPGEVERALINGFDCQTLLSQRKTAYAYLTNNEKDLTAEGDEALALRDALSFTRMDKQELRGTPAYRGKVQGKVLVVTDRADFPKIIGAEILVTHCTFPEMVPYMARVKAIVTEEGGILSHAALISRELKIPSVIGTKVATEVLQTGDIVEVDAEQGIVTKI